MTGGVIHVVLVRWGASTTPDRIERIRETVLSLGAKIPGIESIAEGPSISPEGLERGYDYGFVIDFESREARDRYLPHEDHLPLAKELGEASDAVLVYDLPG